MRRNEIRVMSNVKDLAKAYKVLGESNRLRILKMLEIRPLCVCEITEVLQLATSTVSKHLSILRETGLIIDEKEGKWVNYRLNDTLDYPAIRQLLTFSSGVLINDEIVLSDAEKVMSVDRHEICSV